MQLMTVKDASVLLGLGIHRTRQLADCGALPHTRTPSLVRIFLRADVEKFKAEREKKKRLNKRKTTKK